MKKNLSALLIKIVLLGLSIIICDQLLGNALEHLFYKQTHGDDYTTIYALNESEDNILIFGTSRASHHYKSAMMAEQLGQSCFNAGRDEMEIPYTQALIEAILQRHKPKMIVLDIGPDELAGDKQVLYERIATVLMPFANRYPSLKTNIGRAGSIELLKMKCSKIYPYNSKIGSIIQNSYTSLGHYSELGYEPLYKTIDSTTYKESIWKDYGHKNFPVNDDYLKTLDLIIDMAKANSIRLVLTISPFYFQHDFSQKDGYIALKEKAAKNGLPLFDYTNDPEFILHPTLFNDDVHLNDTGAALYTQKLIPQLRELLAK